jgi:hypothetical protein
MKHRKSYRAVSAGVLLSFLLFAAAEAKQAGAVPPGVEAKPWRMTERSASLFVVGLRKVDAKLVGVELAWVPESLLTACSGKSLMHCRELEQERKIGGQLLLSTEVRMPGAPRPWPREVPSRVITEWISSQSKNGKKSEEMLRTLESVPFIGKWSASLPARGSFLVQAESLDETMMVQGRLRWELWAKGESFRLLAVSRP